MGAHLCLLIDVSSWIIICLPSYSNLHLVDRDPVGFVAGLDLSRLVELYSAEFFICQVKCCNLLDRY